MADKQGWRASLSLTVVGIFGALLGGFVQHLLTLDRERSKVYAERQAEAYVAFLNAFDKHRMSERRAKQGDKKEAARLMDEYEYEARSAVRRIAVFGDKEVVRSLVGWYQLSELPPCDAASNAERAIWEKMRASSLSGTQKVNPSDLDAVVGPCTRAVKQ